MSEDRLLHADHALLLDLLELPTAARWRPGPAHRRPGSPRPSCTTPAPRPRSGWRPCTTARRPPPTWTGRTSRSPSAGPPPRRTASSPASPTWCCGSARRCRTRAP
ncbi:hypothetical protein ACFQ1I_06165 [Kitasatospora arboriphila]